MKILSWNINGYRAILKKEFKEWMQTVDADIVLLQETKVEPVQLKEEELNLPLWKSDWNWSKKRKGYSGTASFCKQEAHSIFTGLDDPIYQGEGRVQLLEYDNFWLFNIYFPNGQMNEERLAYKLGFYDAFLAYAEKLREEKPIIVGGDFNTAHKAIDLSNPKANENSSGFLQIERDWLDKFVAHGYIDTFRLFNAEAENYSWWSYRTAARERNIGWRIDYFFVSEELRPYLDRKSVV